MMPLPPPPSTFLSHHTAAKGLMLTAVNITAWLTLLSPDSLTARSAASADDLTTALAVAAILASAVGWADVFWHDLMGKLIWPSLPEFKRHVICVLLYSSFTAFYLLYAFVAHDLSSSPPGLLGLYYIFNAVWGATLTVAIARETRGDD